MPMPDVEFEARIESLRSRIEPLEKLVHACASRLPAPLRYHSGKEHHGFRYGKPHAEHFCLLKVVRAVSAANAALELARCGYTQEICVLIRTLVECTSHIEFVLSSRDDAGTLGPAAEKYVQDFFADYARIFRLFGAPDRRLTGLSRPPPRSARRKPPETPTFFGSPSLILK